MDTINSTQPNMYITINNKHFKQAFTTHFGPDNHCLHNLLDQMLMKWEYLSCKKMCQNLKEAKLIQQKSFMARKICRGFGNYWYLVLK